MVPDKTNFPDIIYAVDVESNGCSPPEIIELSIVTIDAGVLMWPPSTWTIKPFQPIKAFATNIHGITDADVAQCPPLPLVRDNILSLIQRRSVVAHNAHIDYKLLRLSLPDWQPLSVYDTLRLARFVAPQLPSHRLSSLVAHFGITEELDRRELTQPHRACYDAVAAAHLFLVLVEEARQRGFTIDRILRLSEIDVKDGDPAQGQLL